MGLDSVQHAGLARATELVGGAAYRQRQHGQRGELGHGVQAPRGLSPSMPGICVHQHQVHVRPSGQSVQRFLAMRGVADMGTIHLQQAPGRLEG